MNVRHLPLPAALVALTLSTWLTPGCAARTASGASGGAGTGSEAREAGPIRDERIPSTRQPTQEELEHAFGGGEPRRTNPDVEDGRVVAPMPTAEEAAQLEAKKAFNAAATQLEAELRRGQMNGPTGLRERASALETAAKVLGPEERVRALSLRAAAARLEGEAAEAHALSWSWLRSCGPTEVEACRRAALAEAKRTAAAAPDPKRAMKRVAEVREHDGCVRSAEGAARKKEAPLPPCLSQAASQYRREGDHLMTARIAAARAESKSRVHPQGAPMDLERAAALCTEPRCREVRRRLWQRLAQVHAVNGDREGAARAALKDVGLHAESLPPSERTWARTELAEKHCSALDAEAGTGTCRQLEHRLLGRHHYTDFSRARSPGGEGLPAQTVRTVNTHYAPTFEPCLIAQAARLRPPAHEQYTVHWTVGNDGRVTRMALSRRELQDGPLARCLREALGLWRYPRFEGELQHVEQSFGVTARPR